MPRKFPLVNIQRYSDGVEDIAVDCSVRLWDHGDNESMWVHPILVINILPGSGNISTTIQTS